MVTKTGDNTFLNAKGSPTVIPQEVIRATNEEKDYQITMLSALHNSKQNIAEESLTKIKEAAISHKNIFDELMEASKHCSLGQITDSLFDVGGQYRRNM